MPTPMPTLMPTPTLRPAAHYCPAHAALAAGAPPLAFPIVQSALLGVRESGEVLYCTVSRYCTFVLAALHLQHCTSSVTLVPLYILYICTHTHIRIYIYIQHTQLCVTSGLRRGAWRRAGRGLFIQYSTSYMVRGTRAARPGDLALPPVPFAPASPLCDPTLKPPWPCHTTVRTAAEAEASSVQRRIITRGRPMRKAIPSCPLCPFCPSCLSLRSVHPVRPQKLNSAQRARPPVLQYRHLPTQL